MIGRFVRLFLSITSLISLWGSEALAQDEPQWVQDTLFAIYDAERSCGGPDRVGSINVLGVLDPSRLLEADEEGEIEANLTDILLRKVAPTTLSRIQGDIALTRPGYSLDESDALGLYVREASQADLSILIVPRRLGSTPINFFFLATACDSIRAKQQAGAGKWRVQT